MATKTQRKQKRAPSKPSNDLKLWQLLRIGLRDLHKQETAPRCRVDMGVWMVTRARTCHACLAGSVMRWSNGLKTCPEYEDLPEWAMALDYLRTGRVGDALYVLGRGSNQYGHGSEYDFVPASYREDREAWWDEMRELLRVLKEANL